MRAFIALMPDENQRSHLSEIIDKLHALYPQLHCASLEKLHLTLQFFKDLKIEHVASVFQIMKEATCNQFPFSMQVTKKLLLPNDKHPTVLAYEVQVNKQLKQIKQLLNKSLEQLGYKDEHREFLPHITIARSKDSKLLTEIHLPELNIHSKVTECVLFESCPEAGEFVYKVIGRA